MEESVQFSIGANVVCSDGPCGQVRSVVVDPVAEAVTHLVVEAVHRTGLGRLVPLDLVTTSDVGITLHCDVATFEQLPLAEETQFLPGSYAYASYGPGQAVSWPYYGVGPFGGLGGGVSQAVTYDTLPLGEVAIHRGDPVHGSDGEIGHVQGLVVDRDSHRVSHVLLQEGHLWGRKEVAIPIGSISGFNGEVEVTLTKDQIQELPSVLVDGSRK